MQLASVEDGCSVVHTSTLDEFKTFFDAENQRLSASLDLRLPALLS
jgi:hypothetical protein